MTAPGDSDGEGTKGLRAQAGRGVAWVFTSTAAVMTLRTVLLAGLARLLQPADFGLFAACTTVLGILEVVGLLGVSPALIQRADLTRRHIAAACFLAAVFGAAAAALVWISAGLVAALMKIPDLAGALRIVAPVFFIRGCSMVGYGLAARAMRFRLTAVAEIVSFVVYGIVAAGLAVWGFGAWSLILGYVIQQGVLSLLVLVPFGGQISLGFHRREMRELLGFCGGVSLSSVASYVAAQGDNYVVGRVLGVESLGFYSRAYNLMLTFVSNVINTLDRVLFPSLAKVQDDRERLGRALLLSTVMVWYIYLPLSAVVVLCAPEVVAVLLGPRWLPMVPAFRILAGGLVFRAGCKMGGTILMVRGRTTTLAATQIACAAAVLLGATIGCRRGIEGAATGVLMALGLNYALVNLLGGRAVGFQFAGLWRDLVGSLVVTAAVFLCAMAVQRVTGGFGWQPWARLAVAGPVVAGCYVLCLRAFVPVFTSREVREFPAKLWRDARSQWPAVGRTFDVLASLKPAWAKS